MKNKTINSEIILEARKTSGTMWLFVLCLIVTIPVLCSGDGLTQGYSTYEKIRAIGVYSITATIGYVAGYFLPGLYRFFLTAK